MSVRFRLLSICLVLSVLLNLAFTMYYAVNKYVLVPTKLNESLLLELVQSWRKQNDLPLYKTNNSLCAYGVFRVREIPDDWSHSGFYISADQFRTQYGMNALAENLARGYKSEADVLSSWVNSESHRSNLANASFTDTCVVCIDDYCAQIFANY